MNLTVFIESAELRFRQILEDFFVSEYDEKNLHSHGINHHRRVWRYAREILSLPLITNSSLPACDPEKLIIACYMHDIGMSAEPGPRHGKKSRELCQKFLVSCNLDLKKYNDLLEAVENHDNKNYANEMHENSLLKILSLADDLDAYGFTGIYRYCEIYLKRGIAPTRLGENIRENATGRFDNFTTVLSGADDYVAKHRIRYEILDNFFLNYNKQAEEYNFNTESPSGYCGVIQLFQAMMRMNLSISSFFDEARRYGHDNIIESYIKGLKTELPDDNQDE